MSIDRKTPPRPTLSPEASKRLLVLRAMVAQARNTQAQIWADPTSTLDEKWWIAGVVADAEKAHQQALVRELVGR